MAPRRRRARARPGELVLTAGAAAAGGLRGPAVEGDPGHLVIAEVDGPSTGPGRAGDRRRGPGDPGELPREDVLATFLPRELVSRVRAGQTGWLAEFRRLTVVFVGIRGFDGDAPGVLDRSPRPPSAPRRPLIDRYGGSLNQIVDDDKGLTLVAAWGLPDRTHEDDPARGVLAARAIVDALGDLGLDVSAGVTTGRAFTGVRGGPIRCEYAMIGDVVNLAARLMQSGSPAATERVTQLGRERQPGGAAADDDDIVWVCHGVSHSRRERIPSRSGPIIRASRRRTSNGRPSAAGRSFARLNGCLLLRRSVLRRFGGRRSWRCGGSRHRCRRAGAAAGAQPVQPASPPQAPGLLQVRARTSRPRPWPVPPPPACRRRDSRAGPARSAARRC